MSRMRVLWLVLFAVGTVVPMAHFVGWFAVTGGSLGGLLAEWFANRSVAGLAWDMMISGTVLSLFILYESVVKNDFLPLICLPVLLGIGLSAAFPLYLFLRSRPRG
jgi:hypothetical protein